MIAYLKGLLLNKHINYIILVTNGIGYEIEVPASVLCLLPELLQEVELYIVSYIREDSWRLFGFLAFSDKLIFNSIVQVSGVGPKAAMAMLSVFDGLTLAKLIVQNQVSTLISIPGIGLKTAERLVLELKTKLQKLIASYNSAQIPINYIAKANQQNIAQIIDDLTSTLINLGYKEKQFCNIIESFSKDKEQVESISFENALKFVLGKLSEHVLK